MHFRVKRLIIEQLYKYKAEKIQTQLKEHALAISSALLAKTETVSQMIRDQELGDFLRSVDETTINVEHPAFNPLVTRLNHFKDESIYLSWIAVHHNEDTIDHNGRSRQAETRNGEERYKLANRKWYR
ncbi:MAG TPA: hypothetical protein VHS59_00100, partial [Bacillota bacterium]|nr:hypothetical protein [Bacillota bacterium]